jgi:ATP-dependent Lon protease
MLPLIGIGLGIFAVGAYLLDDAESDNRSARKEYNDTLDHSKRELQSSFSHAQRKDTLDKLFKMKKAKRKVANSIYAELKQANQDFSRINRTIKNSKGELGLLFAEKRATDKRRVKKEVQERINRLQAKRKEFFGIKEELIVHQKELKRRLSVANKETRMVQDEINRV